MRMPAEHKINVAGADKFGVFGIMRDKQHEIAFRCVMHGRPQVLRRFKPIPDAADFDAVAASRHPERLIIKRLNPRADSGRSRCGQKITPIIVISKHAEFAQWRVNLRQLLKTGVDILSIPLIIVAAEQDDIRRQSIDCFHHVSQARGRKKSTMMNICDEDEFCAIEAGRNVRADERDCGDFQPVWLEQRIARKQAG